MRKFKRLPALLIALTVLLLSCIICGIFGGQSAYATSTFADNDYEYGFRYDNYDVTYDIFSNRTMHVTEDMKITFTGYRSTGVIRDLPVNAGEKITDIEVYDITYGSPKIAEHDVYCEDSAFISVKISDGIVKTNETRTYRLEYDYALTNVTSSEKNMISINPIGYGHEAEIVNATITLHLPDGFIESGIKCYRGYKGNKETYDMWNVTGNTVTLSVSNLNTYVIYEGVTFDIPFESNALTTYNDLTPYWIALGGLLLIVLLVVVKLVFFSRDGLTPVTNVDAPNGMDPLEMGKLIDNRVDKSDVTSLIYYWANNGNLKIDLADEKDIVLIQISKSLPEGAPEHQRIMYNKLFATGEVVHINSLSDTFYTTVDAVTKKVNRENGKLYTGKSMAVAVIFALLGALFMGLTPIIYGLTSISLKYFSVLPIFMIIPAFIMFALMQTVRYNKYKKKKTSKILSICGACALALLFTGAYVIIVPSFVIAIVPKILICAVAFAVIISSVILISKTDIYVEKLNSILGFKDFIMSVEKDRLETMIEENPELYYKVLPYAQVLGVSDIWEEKFASININPPDWAVGYAQADIFDLLIFNSMMRSVNRSMVYTMTTRPAPSSSGMSGGFGGFGGGFGGFGGFGHGGGGSRGC